METGRAHYVRWAFLRSFFFFFSFSFFESCVPTQFHRKECNDPIISQHTNIRYGIPDLLFYIYFNACTCSSFCCAITSFGTDAASIGHLCASLKTLLEHLQFSASLGLRSQENRLAVGAGTIRRLRTCDVLF